MMADEAMSGMKFYALFYEVVDDMVNKRVPYREAHLKLIREAHAGGEIVMAGAVGDPPDGALLIFRGSSPEIVEQFVRDDPYVQNGLIVSWKVKPWTIVAGP
jgi:uncharacterized protein YciI